MNISIDTDLLKFYLDNYDIEDIVFNGESLQSLVIDGLEFFTNIYTYTLNDDGTYAIGLADHSYSGTVTIPNTHKGIPVTKIADWGFSETSIRGVLFQANSNITTIGAHAFDCCTGLTSIELPQKVQTIDDYAFFDCDSLTNITIPDKVISLGRYCFKACKALSNIKLNNKLSFIDSYAFQDCSALTSITVPSSVTYLGESIFSGCSKLTDITLPFVGASRTATNSTALFGYIFGTSSYEGSTPATQQHVSGATTYYIPSALMAVELLPGCGNIGYGAFSYCSKIDMIALPKEEIAIGERAFYKCSKLQTISGLNQVSDIGDYAFYECTILNSVLNLDLLISIGKEAFYYCTSLTKVGLEYNQELTYIGDGAFSFCTALTNISIPFGTTSIGSSAFKNTGLTSIDLPNSITSIGTQAFNNCAKLTQIIIPNSLKTIKQRTFQACTSLTSVTIPDSTIAIESNAFTLCTALTTLNITHKAWTIDTTAYSFNSTAEMLSALTANNTGSKAWTKYDIVAPTFGATLAGKSSITITVANSNSIPLTMGGQVVYYIATDGSKPRYNLNNVVVPANGTAQVNVACYDREAVEISFNTATITVWFQANTTLATERVMLSSGIMQGDDSSS